MPHFRRRATAVIAAALLAGLTLTACGGDDDEKASTAGAQATSTDIETTEVPTAEGSDSDAPDSGGSDTGGSTSGGSSTTPAPADPNAKVVPIDAKPSTLEAGGLKVKIRVDRVVDPVKPEVDEAQPGNRLLGVYVESQASGNYEPAKVVTIATLTTKDGKAYPVRVMSGGECEGSFFPAGLLVKSKKVRSGCIGFEIPEDAEPKEINLGVRSTTTGKGEAGRWMLPQAE